MRTPFDLGYLEHILSLHGAKNLKSIVGKIVEAFNKVSLPLDINEVVGLVGKTDWSDHKVVAFSFIFATFIILVSPYIIPLLASPHQAILALHFWRRAR